MRERERKEKRGKFERVNEREGVCKGGIEGKVGDVEEGEGEQLIVCQRCRIVSRKQIMDRAKDDDSCSSGLSACIRLCYYGI